MPLPPCDTTSIATRIQLAFPAASVAMPPCHESKCHDVIVAGTAHKNAILDAYEAKYKSGTDHVVTRIKGKRVLDVVLDPCKRMRPSIDKYYRVKKLTLYNVITTVVKEYYSSFDRRDIQNLATTNKDFSVMIPNVTRWLKIDFTSLREPRYDYENQLEVSHHRVEMASAAMVHFGLDPGIFVRWLGGEYTGHRREVGKILATVKPHILPDDYDQLVRILTQGCPSRLQFDEDLSNKLIMINRGNSKSFIDNPQLVLKTMNKEDRYSHVVPLHEDIVKFSPFCRHTMQTLVTKPGKNDRICWDASTKYGPEEVVLNEVTPMELEAPITFGNTKKIFLTNLYNARISFPDKVILLAMADIKACFRHPRLHPDLTGAFGFNAEHLYYLATAMVFGSIASASSWEPFRRAIEALSRIYANRPDLVIKHRRYLDMIRWEELDPNAILTPAFACSLNPGLPLTPEGTTDQEASIYVDDALMFALLRKHMEMVLAAMIESLFAVMGEADTPLRQCPLAMDKWLELVVRPVQTMIGLVINTNKLTVAIPDQYVAEVRELLDTTWHVGRKSFTVNEAQKLTGKLGHLAEGAPWLHHLMSQMYASIAKALASNKAILLESSHEFKNIIQSLSTGSFACSPKDQTRHISFALKRAARLVHHSKNKYFITKNMRLEIEFLRDKLLPNSDIQWETPIAHIIRRMPSATVYGDSSLTGMGGYSLDLKFWWHLPVPEEVQQRTLLHKADNIDGQLISINVLEFVTVIIDYIASLHVITTTSYTADPHPVLLSVTDNTSALSWTLHACRHSNIGQRLARFFCSLLINSPLGINSKWISTHENTIPDEISRLKAKLDRHSQLTYDFSTLQQTFPELTCCSFFQPKPELISLIWEIVLHEKWPCHEELRILKQSPLGKLTTSSGAQ
jgi:hypothetical protein